MNSISAARGFPPYGAIDEHFTDVLKEHPLYPNDWMAIPGSASSLSSQWDSWKEETLDIIADVLWPRYDRQRGWCGESAKFMEELTRTDLELHPAIRQHLDEKVGASSTTHREFFEAEDGTTRPPGSMHAAYDPALAYRLLEKMPRIMAWSLGAKAGTAAVQFKTVLQRPRAYQMSFLWGIEDYIYLRAATADSPSICSGHSYEGTMMVAGMIERMLIDGEKLDADSWAAFQQYAVDFGDRRVFAGVHHASDNLASWLMVLRIAPRVFFDKRVKEQLWHAISTRSKVFRAVTDAAGCEEGKVYRRVLAALESAARD